MGPRMAPYSMFLNTNWIFNRFYDIICETNPNAVRSRFTLMI